MTFRLSFIALVAAIAVAGCVSVSSKKPMQLSGKQVAQIHDQVRYRMIDPNSTMFRNIRSYDAILSDGKSYQYVCGEVNSKNRMGGYTGFGAFKGHYEGNNFVLEYVDQVNEYIAASACSN